MGEINTSQVICSYYMNLDPTVDKIILNMYMLSRMIETRHIQLSQLPSNSSPRVIEKGIPKAVLSTRRRHTKGVGPALTSLHGKSGASASSTSSGGQLSPSVQLPRELQEWIASTSS